MQHNGICNVKECLWNGREHPKGDLSTTDPMSTKKEKCCDLCRPNTLEVKNGLDTCRQTMCGCHFPPQSESIEWETALEYALPEKLTEDEKQVIRNNVNLAITTAVAKRDEFWQKNEYRRLERYESLGFHKGKFAERKRLVEEVENMKDDLDYDGAVWKESVIEIIRKH